MLSDGFEGSEIEQKESMIGEIVGHRGRGRNRGVVEVEEKEE